MTVSEPTALFTFPFLIYMGQEIYDIIKQLGLIFVPFLVVIVSAFISSRAQGQAEGQAEILALKYIERDFLIKGTVFALCVMPVSFNGNLSYEYKQFTTSIAPSFIDGIEHVNQIKPNTTMPFEIGDESVPFLFGIAQEFTVGFNNALIAKLPCSTSSNGECVRGADFPNIIAQQSRISTDDIFLMKSIKQFHTQCYVPAYDSHVKAERAGFGFKSTNDLAWPNNTTARFAFYSELMNSYYDSNLSSLGEVRDKLSFIPDRSWASQWNDYRDTYCSVMSTELHDWLLKEVISKDGTADYVNSWIGLFGRYSGIDTNGAINPQEPTINTYQANQSLVNALYSNVVNDFYANSTDHFGNDGDDTVGNGNSEHGIRDSIVAINSFTNNTGHVDNKEQNIGTVISGAALDTAHFFALGKQLVAKMFNTYITLTMVQPSIYLSLGALIMLGPLVVVLSGYNPLIAYRLFLVYVGIATTTYVYELSLVLTNNILAFALDFDINKKFEIGSGMLVDVSKHLAHMEVVGNFLVYTPATLIIVWNTLLQYLGGRVIKHLTADALGNAFEQMERSFTKVYKELKVQFKLGYMAAKVEAALEKVEADYLGHVDNGDNQSVNDAIRRLQYGEVPADEAISVARTEIQKELDDMWNQYEHELQSGDNGGYGYSDDDENFFYNENDYDPEDPYSR